MQTRVPEKYLGSNEDATGHGPRLEHAPSTVRQRPRCSHRDRTFTPLPGHLPHWLGLGVGVSVLGLGLGYYEQIRYEMLF